MTETTVQRDEQLKSIINELKTRLAADTTNPDLPPLIAQTLAIFQPPIA